MQQMTMMWKGVCIVVAVRPAEHSGTDALRRAVMEASFKHGLSSAFYKWMLVPSSDGTSFYAWNIARAEIFRELLQNRRDNLIRFRDYHRPCGGVNTMMPAGDYFREF